MPRDCSWQVLDRAPETRRPTRPCRTAASTAGKSPIPNPPLPQWTCNATEPGVPMSKAPLSLTRRAGLRNVAGRALPLGLPGPQCCPGGPGSPGPSAWGQEQPAACAGEQTFCAQPGCPLNKSTRKLASHFSASNKPCRAS